MTTSPIMISARDSELLGLANRSDAMGVLAVWSDRARDLVPHLTEQTTQVRGFQILIEAFRLWEIYEPAHPEFAGRLSDFFLLIEQAFARVVGGQDHDWRLPGSKRVKARTSDQACISLSDPAWHLLDSQKANGLWGLYRGAAKRAKLLADDMTRLSDATSKEATLHPGIDLTTQKHLFKSITRAMDGATVALPKHLIHTLPGGLYQAFHGLPLVEHLWEKLIDAHDLNRQLAHRLSLTEDLDRRVFLTRAARELEDHRTTIEHAIHCENLLAAVESVFLGLCSSKAKTVEHAVADLAVDHRALGKAKDAFGRSGHYRAGAAATRHSRFLQMLDASSPVLLVRSVLSLHKEVSKSRGRAAWVWEEQGVLHSDVEVERPTPKLLQVGVAWRNDYYLEPLQNIVKQLKEVLP